MLLPHRTKVGTRGYHSSIFQGPTRCYGQDILGEEEGRHQVWGWDLEDFGGLEWGFR